MLKTHVCGLPGCYEDICKTRSKRGIPGYPKSQKELDETKFHSRQCFYKSLLGRKQSRTPKPPAKSSVTNPAIDLMNGWALRKQ